ncbi:MAG: hypothetical protein ABJB74_00120 [Gemmatimonas sp.]
MRFRRLTGVVLTLLTLHLNLLGADTACAKHGPANGDVTQHTMVMPVTAASHMHGASHEVTHHSMHTTETAASDVSNMTSEAPPCGLPVQPNCCKALASCSIVFSAGSELDVASIFTAPESIAPSAMTAPPSERAAPEPPPPKA